jgi:hypothetical protein
MWISQVSGAHFQGHQLAGQRQIADFNVIDELAGGVEITSKASPQ